MAGEELLGIIANVALDRKILDSATIREKASEIRRDKRISEELGLVATEFNDALAKRIKIRAEEINNVALHSIAFNWKNIADEIDASKVVCESEKETVERLLEEIVANAEIELDEEAKQELETLLAEEFGYAVEEFQEQIAGDDELTNRFYTTLELDHDTIVHKNITVRDLENKFEGSEFNSAHPNKDHWKCNFCSAGRAYLRDERVSMYLVDDVLGNGLVANKIHQNRPLSVLATICEDCSFRRLHLPCQGFAEVRLFFDLDDDQVKKNVEITDVSSRDDGIPWNPTEVSEKITGIDFGANRMYSGKCFGPEDIVRAFLSIGLEIDIRKIVSWGGEIDGEYLEQARAEYQEFRQKMRQNNHARVEFRDHIQGGTG